MKHRIYAGYVTQTLDSDLLYSLLPLDTKNTAFFQVSNPAMHIQKVIISWKNSELHLFYAVTQEPVHHIEEMKQKEIHLLAEHSWESFTHQNIGSINMYGVGGDGRCPLKNMQFQIETSGVGSSVES